MCKESNYLEISGQALLSNASQIINYVNVPVIGVVKCDGYGASIRTAARIWQSCGVTMFAVSQPREAVALREAGFREDILLLSPVADIDTLQSMLELGIILTVTGLHTAKFYHVNAHARQIRVHVAVDTGMGRFGVPWSETAQLRQIYRQFPFRFEGIFSHFSASFEKRYRKTKLQLDRFNKAVSVLEADGIKVGTRHIANSCAALRFPDTRLDAVRIGSALVGEVSADVPVTLKKAGILKAQVVDWKHFAAGDTTGYASVCKLKRNTNAIVVALGHETGIGYLKTPDNFRLRDLAAYFRGILKLRLHPPCVYYQGYKLNLVGRIGNQYTLFDAGDLKIPPGAYVEAKANMLFPMERRYFI